MSKSLLARILLAAAILGAMLVLPKGAHAKNAATAGAAKQESWCAPEIEALPGLHLGHRVIPIRTIGAYVPGGRYPLF